MSSMRRWKVGFLSGAAITTLAVILWAAYILTATWLRVRYARELASQAEPPPEISLDAQPYAGDPPNSGRLMAADTNAGIGFPGILWDVAVRSHQSLDRLESLQRPSLATVFRHLLGRPGGEQAEKLQFVQAVSFSPQGKALVAAGSSGTFVELSNARASLQLSASAPHVASSGQAVARFVFVEPPRDFQCYSVTDSHGERVILATRPLPHQPGDEPGESSPKREVLLIDAAGRIFVRTHCPESGLIGKLAAPHGKADQIVFGTRLYVHDHDGTFTLKAGGPGAVCIIEGRHLKIVQTIADPSAGSIELEAAESPDRF